MNGSMVGSILCIAIDGYSCNLVRQYASSFSKLVLDEAVFVSHHSSHQRWLASFASP